MKYILLIILLLLIIINLINGFKPILYNNIVKSSSISSYISNNNYNNHHKKIFQLFFSPKPTGYSTTKDGKKKTIEKVHQLLTNTSLLLIIPIEGTNKESIDRLKNQLPESTTAMVIKNSLFQHAAENTKFELLSYNNTKDISFGYEKLIELETKNHELETNLKEKFNNNNNDNIKKIPIKNENMYFFINENDRKISYKIYEDWYNEEEKNKKLNMKPSQSSSSSSSSTTTTIKLQSPSLAMYEDTIFLTKEQIDYLGKMSTKNETIIKMIQIFKSLPMKFVHTLQSIEKKFNNDNNTNINNIIEDILDEKK